MNENTGAQGQECPTCHTTSQGRFCTSCGTALAGEASCRACGATMAPGMRFCGVCGVPAHGGPGAAPALPASSRGWYLAGAALVVVAVAFVLVLRSQGGPPPPAAAPGAPSAVAPPPLPDLSTMSPRERFDRLYERVMTASQTGDQATVTTFTPMALGAYAQLDTIDADARYHVSMLQLHQGGVDVARAQADTILRSEPGHLFGYVVAAAVARWTSDESELTRIYREFLSRYDSEIAAARPEYAEHAGMLADVKRTAEENR